MVNELFYTICSSYLPFSSYTYNKYGASIFKLFFNCQIGRLSPLIINLADHYPNISSSVLQVLGIVIAVSVSHICCYQVSLIFLIKNSTGRVHIILLQKCYALLLKVNGNIILSVTT